MFTALARYRHELHMAPGLEPRTHAGSELVLLIQCHDSGVGVSSKPGLRQFSGSKRPVTMARMLNAIML